MAENTTIVTLPQLVDLSLNCPEMGTFNFNILNVLLQVLIQQVTRNEVAVEFRGEDSDRIQNLISVARPSPITTFNEYSVVVDGKKKKKSKDKKGISLKEIREMSNEELMTEEELRTIERRKDSKQEPKLSPTPLRSPPGSDDRLKGDRSLQTVVVVESNSKLPQFSVAITRSSYEMLQNEVSQLKQRVKELTEMPANMGLIEATRTGSTPILDMFQILTLTKRMDAAEAGMEKLVTLFEDLAKEARSQGDEGSTSVAHSEILEKAMAVREAMDSSRKSFVKSEAVEKLEQRVGNLELFVSELSQNAGGPHFDDSPSVKTGDVKVRGPSAIAGVVLSEIPPGQALTLIQQELEGMRVWIDSHDTSDHHLDGERMPSDTQMKIMETKFTDCMQQLNNIDHQHSNQFGQIQTQLIKLEREVGDLLSKINEILPGGDAGVDSENMMELKNKYQALRKELEVVAEAATKLQEDTEERDRHINSLVEQIDLLKIIKANREDLEDALGDKADACMINRKVSHDQFDAACDDLNKGIEEALAKLSQQEEMWNQALEAIHRDVGNKLDKNEVSPLRDFVNNKLRALQEKFKSLTALKKEQEAAGTKSKFLRNVNCISCDKDVVMRREMDPQMKPQPYAMPPSRNIAPYLAYELDQLRKQQKCVPKSKNLNFFETAIKNRAAKDKDHVCNRYCGGSHTVTTPQQRVTRLGHFLEQWGPEIAPLQDEYIRGKDNSLYKARDDELLAKLASKQPSIKGGKGDAPKASEDTVTKDTGGEITATPHNVDVHAEELLTQKAPNSKLRAKSSSEFIKKQSMEDLKEKRVRPSKGSSMNVIEAKNSKIENGTEAEQKPSQLSENAMKTSTSSEKKSHIGFQE